MKRELLSLEFATRFGSRILRREFSKLSIDREFGLENQTVGTFIRTAPINLDSRLWSESTQPILKINLYFFLLHFIELSHPEASFLVCTFFSSDSDAINLNSLRKWKTISASPALD